MTRYVDPVLLAVSDCLVLTALERAGSRVLPRSARAGVRHRAYEQTPVRPDRVDRALDGAWDLTPLLAARHDLDVDPAAWTAVLDGYTRALLLMSQRHTASRLQPHLYPLGATGPAARPYLEVAGRRLG